MEKKVDEFAEFDDGFTAFTDDAEEAKKEMESEEKKHEIKSIKHHRCGNYCRKKEHCSKCRRGQI